uniref:Uncharacterized protein n=1 Tax=Arundo donax TaxID=35708 RepID=A0A0A9F3E1_ARUDO
MRHCSSDHAWGRRKLKEEIGGLGCLDLFILIFCFRIQSCTETIYSKH